MSANGTADARTTPASHAAFFVISPLVILISRFVALMEPWGQPTPLGRPHDHGCPMVLA